MTPLGKAFRTIWLLTAWSVAILGGSVLFGWIVYLPLSHFNDIVAGIIGATMAMIVGGAVMIAVMEHYI